MVASSGPKQQLINENPSLTNQASQRYLQQENIEVLSAKGQANQGGRKSAHNANSSIGNTVFSRLKTSQGISNTLG
jgi:hypothetical protein